MKSNLNAWNTTCLLFLVSLILVSCSSRVPAQLPEAVPTATSTLPTIEGIGQASVTPALPTASLQPTFSLPSLEPIATISLPEALYHPLQGISLEKILPEYVEKVSQVGSAWTRRDFSWAYVEPSPGQRDWASVYGREQEILTASQAGINVILIVGSTPVWAWKSGYSCGAIAPEHLESLGLFLFDLVQRYSVAPYNVKYWELWNEPDAVNFMGCWGDESDVYYGGGYYAEMLKVAYLSMKAADPDAQVLIGGLLMDCDPFHPSAISGEPGTYKNCTSSRFLEGILAAGGGDYFDGISFHAYDYYGGQAGKYANTNWASSWDTTGPTMIAKANYLRQVLNQFGYNKYLMNTEVAVICGRDGSEPYCQTEEYQLTKAYYVVQSHAIALALDLKVNMWFSLLGWRGSQLLANDLSPLPAYHAFSFSVHELENARFVSPVLSSDLDSDLATEIVTYVFDRGDCQIWLTWSVDGGTYPLPLPGTPSAIYDVMGNPLPVAGDVFNVGIAPVYLEWTK